jgi:hypothetical protein
MKRTSIVLMLCVISFLLLVSTASAQKEIQCKKTLRDTSLFVSNGKIVRGIWIKCLEDSSSVSDVPEELKDITAIELETLRNGGNVPRYAGTTQSLLTGEMILTKSFYLDKGIIFFILKESINPLCIILGFVMTAFFVGAVCTTHEATKKFGVVAMIFFGIGLFIAYLLISRTNLSIFVALNLINIAMVSIISSLFYLLIRFLVGNSSKRELVDG